MKDHGYAFFDLDYTLIPQDTLLLFCNYVLKKERMRMLYLAFFLPFTIPALFRWIRSRRLKRIFLSFLWKMPAEKVDRYARDFVRQSVLPQMYPEMIEEIERNRKEGKTLVLNTASPEFYVKHIAEALKFDYHFATRVILRSPMPLIPRIDGNNNKHIAKIEAMLPILPEDVARTYEHLSLDGKTTYPKVSASRAYSDSPADLPMLRMSEECYMIHPESNTFIQEGNERGWFTLTPARPYKGNGKILASLRQVIGLYPLSHEK